MDRHPNFFVTDGCIFEVVWDFFVRILCASVRISNPSFSLCYSILVLISCIYCKYVSRSNLRDVLMYVDDCNRMAAPFLWLNYVV